MEEEDVGQMEVVAVEVWVVEEEGILVEVLGVGQILVEGVVEEEVDQV